MGFQHISAERRREIAAMSGKAVPNSKRSFAQNSDLASSAGRKGGSSVSPDRRAYSVDRELAVSSGRKGAQSKNGAAK